MIEIVVRKYLKADGPDGEEVELVAAITGWIMPELGDTTAFNLQKIIDVIDGIEAIMKEVPPELSNMRAMTQAEAEEYKEHDDESETIVDVEL